MAIDAKRAIFRRLLLSVRDYLIKHDDMNWIRGIEGIIGELDSDKTERGFNMACAAYKSIVLGGRGFSEYNVWHEDALQRKIINSEIDSLRKQIWAIVEDVQ